LESSKLSSKEDIGPSWSLLLCLNNLRETNLPEGSWPTLFLPTSTLILSLCILTDSPFLSPSFLILEDGPRSDLEIDWLLLEEPVMAAFTDNGQGLLPPLDERFIDALTLSFKRASRSRPAFSLLLGLLSVAPQVLAAFLLAVPPQAFAPWGGILLDFLKTGDLWGGAASSAVLRIFLSLLGNSLLLHPRRVQQEVALWRGLSSLNTRIEPALVTRRPPAVRLPMASSISAIQLK
jgi:hypothetical protein